MRARLHDALARRFKASRVGARPQGSPRHRNAPLTTVASVASFPSPEHGRARRTYTARPAHGADLCSRAAHTKSPCRLRRRARTQLVQTMLTRATTLLHTRRQAQASLRPDASAISSLSQVVCHLPHQPHQMDAGPLAFLEAVAKLLHARRTSSAPHQSIIVVDSCGAANRSAARIRAASARPSLTQSRISHACSSCSGTSRHSIRKAQNARRKSKTARATQGSSDMHLPPRQNAQGILHV